jgi:hypothetical protein
MKSQDDEISIYQSHRQINCIPRISLAHAAGPSLRSKSAKVSTIAIDDIGDIVIW